MEFLLFFCLFIVGLASIIKGADWLTEGAANVAERMGVPTMVVGMTIVAIGSSAPEFVVSMVAALQGNSDIALGNIVGSNIFNILGIMGVTAIVRPLLATRGNVRNDVPFVMLSSVVIAVTAFDSFFTPGAEDGISRTDGLLMLAMFAIFMSYTLALAKKPESTEDVPVVTEASSSRKSVLKDVAFIIVGLTLLVLGGDWLVDGASGIASSMHISDAIIALTIVSAGTSAPEMAASVMAARKGDTAMALGNIVGSVAFNVFFVLGSAATVRPIGVGGITPFDIITLLTASLALWVLCRFGKHRLTLTRGEGWVLVLMAVAYYVYRVVAL